MNRPLILVGTMVGTKVSSNRPNIHLTHAMRYVIRNNISSVYVRSCWLRPRKYLPKASTRKKHDICFPFLSRVIRGFCHSHCRVELKAQ